MEYGLNLFSLRKNVSTKDGFFETCVKLKQMGYSYLQCSGMAISASEIKEVCDKTGFSVKLTHSPLKRILEDTDNLVREHDLLGCDYIGLGWIDISGVNDESSANKIIETLENAAVILKKKNKKFLYHNHNSEFIKIGSKSFYDMLIENTTDLGFIIDTYWVQAGGANILEYVDKLKRRIDCVHLKDYKVESGSARFAAIGDGNINFQDVLSAMKKSEAKYYFVEQDDAETYADPFMEVKKSIDHLLLKIKN